MWDTTITKVENGFTIVYSEDADEGIRHTTEVIECSGNEKETMTKVFEWVADQFGLSYEKFGSENLSISWDGKGHKV